MMNEQLEKIFQKNPDWNKVYSVVEKCQKAGHQTVLVGGAVRDALLGRVPKDFDIASSASPDQLLKIFPYAHAVGKSFGVIWIPFKNGKGVEIATFRKDGAYQDGRHPTSVEFCSLEQDTKRRDFTVNALYYDTQAHQLIDGVDGVKDLKSKLIRCVGDSKKRFEEDHLRVLRGIRFAVTLDFSIEKETFNSIKSIAPQLKKISPERILDELNKTFIQGKFKSTVDYLKQIQLLEIIFNKWDHYDHPFWNIPPSTKPLNFWWSLLLTPIGIKNPKLIKPFLEESLLCFSNQQVKQILDFFNFFSNITKKEVRLGCKMRWLSHNEASWYLDLTQHIVSDQKEMLDNLKKQHNILLKDGKLPPPLVTGNDLIEKGLSKGPQFSELLEKLYDDQLEGIATSKAELLKRINL